MDHNGHRRLQKNDQDSNRWDRTGVLSPGIPRPRTNALVIAQRAAIAPHSLTPEDVMQMQRGLGNRAVGRLLETSAGQPLRTTEERESLQRGHIDTGMTDSLKTGLESWSGMDISEVRACYKSDQMIEMGGSKEKKHKPSAKIEVFGRDSRITGNQMMRRKLSNTNQRASSNREMKIQHSISSDIVQCYHKLVKLPNSTPMGHLIINGNDTTFGDYHITVLSIQEAKGVFKEFHVVFQKYDRRGYFFYDDNGNIIKAKSSGLDQKDQTLTDKAQKIAKDFLAQNCQIVSDGDVNALIDAYDKQKKKEQILKEKNLKERDEQAAQEIAQSFEAQIKKITAEDELARELDQNNLLRPIQQTVGYSIFKRFNLKDQNADKWPSAIKGDFDKIKAIIDKHKA